MDSADRSSALSDGSRRWWGLARGHQLGVTAPLRLPAVEPGDPALLLRQLRWLVAIRLVVVTAVALLYFLLTLLPSDPLGDLDARFLFSVTALTYGASLLYIVLLQLFPRRVGLQAYVQFVGDLSLITLLVYYYGGAASPFSLLYLVVISIAATLLRRGASFFIASIAYLFYSGCILGTHLGWLPAPPETFAEPVTPARLAYHLLTHLLGFYGVAMLTSYLARNVTLAEQELEEKREDLADLQVVYHDVIQSISSGLVTTDLEGRVTSINRAGEQLLAADGIPLLGRPITEIGFFTATEWEQHARRAHHGERTRNEIEIRPPWVAGPLVLGFSLTPLTDAHGTHEGYILVFQDLSEWRRLQEELRLKDRMAAVGELAAGLAHEVGNPLAAISGSVQMLTPGFSARSQQGKLLQILLKESQRLDRTIKSFLQFARPRERTDLQFDIAALLEEHAELLRNSRELRDDHRLEVDLQPPEAQVVADPDQVSQIFWNLVRNALRAMPEGGTLRVSGRLQESGVYLLEVADTGRGMSEQERAKIFHPFKSFFDQGTGIGMAIVYRIVEEHGGRLLVDSAPGRGTAITAELPIGLATPAATVAEPSPT